MPRAIVIGDVHGCTSELDELVAALRLAGGDRLYFLGDLVDRGPDSVGAVRRVRELLDAYPGSVCIAGNHEDNAIRARARTGAAARDVEPWTAAADDATWAFLESLPLGHRIEDLGVLLVHGGLYPRFFEQHGAVGELPAAWRTGGGKRGERMRRFLRVRRIDGGGKHVGLDTPRDGTRHWSEWYDGREGVVYFGHDPQMPPVPLVTAHAIGIDTACCFGGRLTAAVIADDPRTPRFVSVAARRRYVVPRSFDADG